MPADGFAVGRELGLLEGFELGRIVGFDGIAVTGDRVGRVGTADGFEVGDVVSGTMTTE